MKSVVLFSALSFLVIFIVVFIVTGVFSRAIEAWKQSRVEGEEVRRAHPSARGPHTIRW